MSNPNQQSNNQDSDAGSNASSGEERGSGVPEQRSQSNQPKSSSVAHGRSTGNPTGATGQQHGRPSPIGDAKGPAKGAEEIQSSHKRDDRSDAGHLSTKGQRPDAENRPGKESNFQPSGAKLTAGQQSPAAKQGAQDQGGARHEQTQPSKQAQSDVQSKSGVMAKGNRDDERARRDQEAEGGNQQQAGQSDEDGSDEDDLKDCPDDCSSQYRTKYTEVMADFRSGKLTGENSRPVTDLAKAKELAATLAERQDSKSKPRR